MLVAKRKHYIAFAVLSACPALRRLCSGCFDCLTASVFVSLFLTPAFLSRSKLRILGQNIALGAVMGMGFGADSPLR